MDRKPPLAIAVSAVAGFGAAAPADATVHSATLVSFGQYSNGATSSFNGKITSSTATWSYDDATKLLSQTGGTFNVRFTTSPSQTLFRHLTTGLVVGNGVAVAATSFVCAEGNFGTGVGASICGNYTFGGNFVNESTATWGPGVTTGRTIGGDDNASGPQQSLAIFDGMSTVSWVGTTLQISNRTCTGSCATLPAGTGYNRGYIFTLNVVPLPAAAWLFGGSLLLAGVRRRGGS
jgi:hypothetical protein